MVLLLVVALDVEEVLDGPCHRSYDVSKEEMTEPDFAKRLDNNMPKCFRQLNPTSKVEEVERHQAHDDEGNEQND